MPAKIHVLPTPAIVAAEAARLVFEAIRLTPDVFSLVLAGGQTPRSLYEILASEPYSSRIDWARLRIYFGDERCVPPDHADSNYRMAREALLDAVRFAPENVFRIRGEIEPEAAAIEYGRLLKAQFGEGGPDLVLLGMGADGHTASLFPETSALDETRHRCVATLAPRLNAARVTMTAPFINRAAQVLVMVTGADKAETVMRVFEGEYDPRRLPIQLIQPRGEYHWLMDAAAAGM